MPVEVPAAESIQRPLTLAQYAALMGVEHDTAWRWCKAGKVPGAVRIGRGDWRIPLAAVPPSLQPAPAPTETLRQRRKRHERAMAQILAAK